VHPTIVRQGLRLPGWTGTGRSRSGASPHVSHGKRQADCGWVWVVVTLLLALF